MPTTYDVVEGPSSALDSEMADTGFVSASVARNFSIMLSDGTDQNSLTVKIGSMAATPPLPREGDRHPSNVNFVCKSVNIEQISVNFYTASCSYQSPVFETGDDTQNPLAIPADIKFATVVSEEATEMDINGNPLVNTAGDPFTGITMEITDMSININKNVATFNPTQMQYFNGALNSDAFLGYQAGQIKLQNYTATPVIGDVNYWKLGIQMLARTPTPLVPADKVWFLRLQNKGRYFIDNTGGTPKRKPAKIGENVNIASNVEVNLDASGGQLPDGAPPQFLFFPMNLTASFNDLGIL